jgi:hypothetical protein
MVLSDQKKFLHRHGGIFLTLKTTNMKKFGVYVFNIRVIE